MTLEGVVTHYVCRKAKCGQKYLDVPAACKNRTFIPCFEQTPIRSSCVTTLLKKTTKSIQNDKKKTG